MPRPVQARAWWADVEDVRDRIERRRERERDSPPGPRTAVAVRARRGVREVQPGRHLMLVRTLPPPVQAPRRRSRPLVVARLGSSPDRIAAWAVVLGVLLLMAAVLSSRG